MTWGWGLSQVPSKRVITKDGLWEASVPGPREGSGPPGRLKMGEGRSAGSCSGVKATFSEEDNYESVHESFWWQQKWQCQGLGRGFPSLLSPVPLGLR